MEHKSYGKLCKNDQQEYKALCKQSVVTGLWHLILYVVLLSLLGGSKWKKLLCSDRTMQLLRDTHKKRSTKQHREE